MPLGNLVTKIRKVSLVEREQEIVDAPVEANTSLVTDLKLCQWYQSRWEQRDYTFTCNPVEFNSNIQLYDHQSQAVEVAIERGGGVIVSPAGSGKTVMGLEIIARLRQPTLWITHTKELLYQVIDRAVQFLDIDRDEIGILGDGKRTIGERFTAGLVQTLVKGIPDELLSGTLAIGAGMTGGSG